jgi:hypothetical protein
VIYLYALFAIAITLFGQMIAAGGQRYGHLATRHRLGIPSSSLSTVLPT